MRLFFNMLVGIGIFVSTLPSAADAYEMQRYAPKLRPAYAQQRPAYVQQRPYQLPAPLNATPLERDYAPLWRHTNTALQKRLDRAVRDLGLGHWVKRRKLAVALVDITNLYHPRVATLNGNEMMYAASLPKIAILLAAFEKIRQEEKPLTEERKQQMVRMIRRSSNEDATTLIRWVSQEFIAKVLVSYRYRLYDPLHNGGLWVGKEYGKAGQWRRDPINNISHGATAIQVARFYYLLETGHLVNKTASRHMKAILAHSAITHKFKLGLKKVRPRARIYRKSGTWKRFHADSGIIERRGARYIAVALAEHAKGGKWLEQLIGAMDRAVGK